jgi:hypothetical protein
MRIEEAKYSILEIADWYRKRELTVNKEYHRASGLWPRSAKSYFIDTILKGFPFTWRNHQITHRLTLQVHNLD